VALLRFPIPEAIQHTRYGVSSYLNPRILELVTEIQPEEISSRWLKDLPKGGTPIGYLRGSIWVHTKG